MTFAAFLKELPRDLFIGARENNKLRRYMFIFVYTVLNILLYSEAASRHAGSPKGKALRGENFLACAASGSMGTTVGTPILNNSWTRTGVLLVPCATDNDANGVLVAGSALLREVGAGGAYPFAKGFGQLLNLNCMVLLLPVVRSAVKRLHDATSLNPAWYVAWVAYVVELDKNIVMHKAVAKYALAILLAILLKPLIIPPLIIPPRIIPPLIVPPLIIPPLIIPPPLVTPLLSTPLLSTHLLSTHLLFTPLPSRTGTPSSPR
jgi:uncharacterized membrane protein YhaH (DUF805 family)